MTCLPLEYIPSSTIYQILLSFYTKPKPSRFLAAKYNKKDLKRERRKQTIFFILFCSFRTVSTTIRTRRCSNRGAAGTGDPPPRPPLPSTATPPPYRTTANQVGKTLRTFVLYASAGYQVCFGCSCRRIRNMHLILKTLDFSTLN